MNEGRNGEELDQSALNGVHYRFQSIVSPQLLVDVVKVIAQGLKANLEALRNFGGVLSGGKEPHNFRLLFGKRGHGRHGWSSLFSATLLNPWVIFSIFSVARSVFFCLVMSCAR